MGESSSKRMRLDSSIQTDRLSNLPDIILIMIISSLSFKECLRTSVLSKRWRYLCRETRNIAFKESEYVDRSASDKNSKRISFVDYMCQWVSRFPGQYIESFEIYFYCPHGFVAEIESLIEFAVSRQVKNLVLDFSSRTWRTTRDASWYNYVVVQLPVCVYSLTSLNLLKIYSCGFDPSKFTNSGLPRSLSIGWIKLTKVESLLSNSPTLKSLSINYCWGMDITEISGDLREFTFENCKFDPFLVCSFDLPKVEIFKYSGKQIQFHYKRMNTVIKEVYLDFGEEGEFDDEPNLVTKVAGEVLAGFLNCLQATRTLTVCPYLLQVIPECDDPHFLRRAMHTKHLVLRTRLHVMEYKGIRLLLDKCPNLETLTIDMLGLSFFPKVLTYAGIHRRTYWPQQNRTYKNLPKGLKVVVVKNFSGQSNELYVLKFLIRPGRKRVQGPKLERVELYVPNDMEESRRELAYAKAEMLQNTSGDVQVVVHKT